jgi:GT2 family glycosyltransferase
MLKVSIVILNWNQPLVTIECLNSIANLKPGDYKVKLVLVDNASKDKSAYVIGKALKKLYFNRKGISYKLIKNKNNLGFAGGNNVGIKYAINRGCDYVVVLNNDTVIDKDFINEIIRAAEKYPDAGMFSPKIYFAPGYEFHKDKYDKNDIGKVIWSAGGDIDWQNVYSTHRGVDEVDEGQFDKFCEIDFATGACFMVKSEVVKKVGMFDSKYYLYLEDADFCLKVKAAGWKIIYTPSARIWHKVSASSGIGSELNDYFITRNRLLFGMRYAPVRTRFALYRESLRLLLRGRKWQRRGVLDFYFNEFGKGSWK